MKVIFNDYTYFDPNDNSQNIQVDDNNINKEEYLKYRFDVTRFNTLINDGDFKGAADYASQFHINNNQKAQNELTNYITNLRREGRKMSAIYSRITSQDDKNKIKFLDNLFVPNGLSSLSSDGNTYAQEYIDFLTGLGSTTEQQATKLSVTFEPEKQYGLFGWDWLKHDNKYNIDSFYELSGLSEVQLREANIEIKRDEAGRTTLIFDKANNLTNKILMSIPNDYGTPASYSYNQIYHPGLLNGPVIKGLANDNKEISIVNGGHLANMQKDISSYNNRKEELFSVLDFGEKTFASTIVGYIDDNLVQLQNAVSSGEISQAQYNSMFKQMYSDLESGIIGSGFTQYEEMYSNVHPDNKEITDETLRLLTDSKDRENLQHLLSANLNKLTFQVMISDGKIGTLISIPAEEKIDNDKPTDANAKPEEWIARKEIQVFIPNFAQGREQAKINENTYSRAYQEINDMQNWGYDYDCTDGETIYADSQGHFFKDSKPITFQEAVTDINKSMIIEDTRNALQFKYTNKDGNIYDTQAYETSAKRAAVNAVNELYPGIDLFDNKNGDITDKDIEELFNKQGAGASVLDKYAVNMNTRLYNKYIELFDIYEQIIKGLDYYKS